MLLLVAAFITQMSDMETEQMIKELVREHEFMDYADLHDFNRLLGKSQELGVDGLQQAERDSIEMLHRKYC